MYLRDTAFPTLGDLAESVHDLRRTWSGSSTGLRVSLDRESQAFDLGGHEVPATEQGIAAVAAFYDVPTKFIGRVMPDEQQFILDHRIQRSEDVPVVVRYDDSGISEVYRNVGARVSVEALVERMLDHFPTESQVVEWWSTPEEFRADVVVPENFDRGVGGDRRVGDITHGGVRVGQDRAANLAPWVQPYLFRLVCTNGMEIRAPGMRIEGRGADEESIVRMFGNEVKVALDRVDSDIAHFYDLRSQRVEDDRTGVLRRVTQEYGLPDRTIGRMEDTLADALMAEDEVTMFHLANHITNQANDPSIRHRTGQRRRLEQAGGLMISDHAARCTACHSRLN